MEFIKKYRLELMLVLGVVIAVFGCVLIMLSFYVHPIGIIDGSVMITVGEVFTFSGALIGITATYKTNLKQLKEDLKNGKEIE